MLRCLQDKNAHKAQQVSARHAMEQIRIVEEQLEGQTALVAQLLAQAAAKAAADEQPSEELVEARARVASLQALLGRSEREADALREQARRFGLALAVAISRQRMLLGAVAVVGVESRTRAGAAYCCTIRGCARRACGGG